MPQPLGEEMAGAELEMDEEDRETIRLKRENRGSEISARLWKEKRRRRKREREREAASVRPTAAREEPFEREKGRGRERLFFSLSRPPG